MPIYPQSVSPSPPRGNLTSEEWEPMLQQGYAQWDTKGRMRRERSTSNLHTASLRVSPDMMSKSLSSYYPGVVALSPVISHGSLSLPNISSRAYLAPYTPQLDGGDMYGGVFQMAANDFTGAPAYSMPMAYATLALDHSVQNMYLPQNPFLPLHLLVRRRSPHSHSASSIDLPNVQMVQSIHHNQIPSKIKAPDAGGNVRVVYSRPKPHCWEHGCKGRRFSTFSNLLRHQREKSGVAAKSTCPNCGTEFTRTTARNEHMALNCKQPRAT